MSTKMKVLAASVILVTGTAVAVAQSDNDQHMTTGQQGKNQKMRNAPWERRPPVPCVEAPVMAPIMSVRAPYSGTPAWELGGTTARRTERWRRHRATTISWGPTP